MKKRIISFILTLAMLFGLASVCGITASAATSTVSSGTDSRINYMLTNIDYQNFSGATISGGTVTASQVKDYIRHFIYDASFAAIDGEGFNYPNSGAYTWEVTDGTYTRAIRGSTGCCAYCYFVSKVVYGVDWFDSKQQTRLNSAAELKSFLLQYGQAGEHLRADPSHSVTFISGDENGFYCFSYCGDSNPVIHLDYWTYEAFYSRYSGYSIYVYDVYKADNSSTMECRDGHSYNCAVVSAPTETETGRLRCYCPVCHNTKDVTLPKLSTADYRYERIGQVTCTGGAVDRYTWKNTEYGTFYFDKQLGAGSHNYEYSVSANPTESEAGSIMGRCSKCGDTKYISIPALGAEYDQAVLGEATCTAGCTLRYTLKDTTYGSYHFDKQLPAMGHAYFDNKVTQDPTATASGKLSCECFRCRNKLEITLPAFGDMEYSYEEKVAPGCAYCGTGTWTWLVQEYGDYSFDVSIPPTGHSFVNGACSVCGAVDPSRENPFDDLTPGEYYFDPVLWAAENRITKGTEYNLFSPEETVTRAQVVTFLWRAAGNPAPKSAVNPFTDVSPDEYYYDAVLWAVEKGITRGTDETLFSPDETCTRAQIVTFLARFAGVADTATASVFEDVSADDYFAAAVKWAVDSGVTYGTDETHFSPDDNCTRAQAVTFLYRWMTNKQHTI